MSTTAPRRALIVIDVQNEYFPGGGLLIEYPPTTQSLPNITRAMDAATAAGVPVVVGQHHLPPGAPAFQASEHNGQLHPEVASRPRAHLITKTFASVFTGTDFADWIARNEVDTLTIAGFMTHHCDASTIYEAHHRGLNVEFLADASGSLPYANAAGRVSAEEIHRVYSVVFNSGFAGVGKTADWIAALESRTLLPTDNLLSSNQRGCAPATAGG